VRQGALSERRLVEALTIGPARAFGLPAGTLAPGAAADLAILDPEAEWTLDPAKLHSKGRNTPWKGKRLLGVCVYTIVGGRIVHGEGWTER
jgi:dihydroorotase